MFSFFSSKMAIFEDEGKSATLRDDDDDRVCHP